MARSNIVYSEDLCEYERPINAEQSVACSEYQSCSGRLVSEKKGRTVV